MCKIASMKFFFAQFLSCFIIHCHPQTPKTESLTLISDKLPPKFNIIWMCKETWICLNRKSSKNPPFQISFILCKFCILSQLIDRFVGLDSVQQWFVSLAESMNKSVLQTFCFVPRLSLCSNILSSEIHKTPSCVDITAKWPEPSLCASQFYQVKFDIFSYQM